MKFFSENYDLKSLIKQPTCYKNPNNLTCIDLILNNWSFQSTCVIETELPDFHMMILTVMGKDVRKFQSRIINCSSYKHFLNESYRKGFINTWSQESFVHNDEGFYRFCAIRLATLSKHVP